MALGSPGGGRGQSAVGQRSHAVPALTLALFQRLSHIIIVLRRLPPGGPKADGTRSRRKQMLRNNFCVGNRSSPTPKACNPAARGRKGEPGIRLPHSKEQDHGQPNSNCRRPQSGPHRHVGMWIHGQVPHERLQDDPVHLRRRRPHAAAGAARATRRRTWWPREAARYGFERFCTDWHELVADEQIDVLDNCGPDPAHPEPCIAALRGGKHVICEKPMAISVEDARRMRDAAAAASGKAMCTFNYRFLPAVRLAKDLIAEGRIGTVYHIRVQLPANGRPRPGAAAGPGVVLGLAAFRRPAGHRQPRHRPVPLPAGRDQERFGPGPHV